MEIELSALPGTARLYRDYVSRQTRVLDFFQWEHFDERAPRRQAEILADRNYNRKNLSEILHDQNRALNADRAALTNCRRLVENNCLAVVTGQQVGLLGGPLFVLFKALHTVKLASEYEQELRQPVVPIFWLELEDHDIDEVNRLTVLDAKHELHALKLAVDAGAGRRPVKSINLGEDIEKLISELENIWMRTEFSEGLFSILRYCCTDEDNFGTSFAKIHSHLLSRFGLVLADPSHSSFKERSVPLFLREIEQPSVSLNEFAEHERKIIASGYDTQVKADKDVLSLFLMVEGSKNRLVSDDGGFKMRGTSIRLSRNELGDILEKNPTRLIPSVLLRPLVQDTLFPTLAYVAGPSEVSYFAQLKPLYKALDVPMPIVMPRPGGTILSSSAKKTMDKYNIELTELFQSRDSLIRRVRDVHMPTGAKQLFAGVKQEMEQALSRLREGLDPKDEGFASAAETAERKIVYQLDKLEEKYKRSLERTNDVLSRQINRLANSIYPKGALQERILPIVHFLNLYGPGLIDKIADSIDPLRPSHKIIEI